MGKRTVPEVGAGSMSDISFLLLTFFLLTSSVDQNKGMARRLPPMSDQDQQQETTRINERNILLVKVNSNDRLAINRQLSDVSELKERVKIFLTSDGRNKEMPEVDEIQIDGLGMQVVSKGIVSLNTDRGTSYKMYMGVQNEIMKAYNELRDEFALTRFGKSFNALQEEEQEAVKKKYPLNLSEAEPTDATKKTGRK
ncbi:MAG: biopolymer transporter ExbD [Prevotellaceae bacterium]|jgi:biopolymer transport protein ExbD|nr:biopolymer transporter ExbD [Prevotellaceae bacterium]